MLQEREEGYIIIIYKSRIDWNWEVHGVDKCRANKDQLLYKHTCAMCYLKLIDSKSLRIPLSNYFFQTHSTAAVEFVITRHGSSFTKRRFTRIKNKRGGKSQGGEKIMWIEWLLAGMWIWLKKDLFFIRTFTHHTTLHYSHSFKMIIENLRHVI